MTWNPEVLKQKRDRMAAIVAEYQSGSPTERLADKYLMTNRRVAKIIKDSGVPMRPATRLIREAEKSKIIDLYSSGKTFREIQSITGRDFGRIRKIVHDSGFNVHLQGGLNKSKAHRKYALNEGYFDSVDTERKAWVLGFISSDGNVYKDNRITIGLKWSDHEILEEIAKELECNAPVTKKTQKYNSEDYHLAHFNFASLRLANSLRDLGVVENKSLILKPWEGPVELMPHYWRGMIDGDGCLSQSRGRWSLSLSGNEFTCEAFSGYCRSHSNTKAKAYKVKNSNGWTSRFSGSNVVFDLVAHFYANSTISLPRKLELARQIMSSGLSLANT